MLPLTLGPRAVGGPPIVVALGAHCDDLEIGAGATLLRLATTHPGLVVDATVLTSTPERAVETRSALTAFLPGAQLTLTVHELRDGRLPTVWDDVKDLLEAVRRRVPDTDLVLSPSARDAHQDHRVVGELVPTTFRDHLVLQYEILKWDGDLGRPSVYVPVPAEIAERKWALLYEHYPSQRSRSWFDREALLGLMRMRGVEANTRYAEAFYCTKAIIDLGGSA